MSQVAQDRLWRSYAAALSPLLLVASIASGGCDADGGTPGSLAVADAWSRPVAVEASTASVGVVYLSLYNGTTLEQQLVGLETPVASRAEIHETRMEGDIARMRQADSIHLPPGETVELRPGGIHGMLMGVNRELAPGDRFPLTLIFAGGDSLSTTVEVRRP
jgi:copper(I)-binding protein